MQALRAIAFTLFQVITVVPVGIVCLLCAPLPRRIRYRVTITWPSMAVWAAKVLLGIRYRMIGTENFPDGPAIVLSKHQSTWETLFYVSHLPREMCFVFKRELLLLPFFGWGIWLLDMIHINRRKGRDAFEEVAIDYAVTFEESPPSWESARVAAPEPVLQQTPAADLETDTAYMLRGEIKSSRFGDLAAYVGEHDLVLIDCAELTRMDFISAGALLNALTAVRSSGKQIVFRHPNHLVAELLGIIGLRAVASVVFARQ